MRRLVLVLILLIIPVLLLSGCALRTLPPPIVQTWTALLVHDETVVFATPVTELWPVMTLTQCPTRSGLRRVSTGYGCHERLFRFVSLDRKHRTAIYRELVP